MNAVADNLLGKRRLPRFQNKITKALSIKTIMWT